MRGSFNKIFTLQKKYDMNENFPDKNQCKIEIAHQNFVIPCMTTRRTRPSKKKFYVSMGGGS